MQHKDTPKGGTRQSVYFPALGITASGRVVKTPEPGGGGPVSRFALVEPGSGSRSATGCPPVKVLGSVGWAPADRVGLR